MKKLSTNSIVKVGIVAAIYVAITLALAPISYGEIQFRISEVLVLLAFIDPLYIPGLVLGCVIANLGSPLGIIDIGLGSLATFLSVSCIYGTRKVLGERRGAIIIASLWPVIFNGIIVGAMLNYLFQVPLLIAMGSVAIGEFVVVSILGVLLFKILFNNKGLMERLVLTKK